MTTRTNHLVHALGLAAALAAVGCGEPWGPHPINKEGPGPDLCDAAIKKVGLPCEDPEVVRAKDLLRQMTLVEKVQQMSGPAYNPNNMFDQEDNARLSVPGYRFMDGPRGVRWMNSDYGTTVFPVAEARASTWNPSLETAIGKVEADEMRYLGRHVLLAPTINQVTHPRWGRAQESYGEDSHLLGVMGEAFIAGAQATPENPADYRIQACAKHLAANNIEDTRIYVNAVLDERTLREVYLPHFKKASDAGVSCVMASYNRVNGSYSGYSKAMVRDILKGEWGYQGWVVSDWFAKGATLTSPAAGLDIEMPFSSGAFPTIFDSAYFYGNLLQTAVEQGKVDEALIDEAVLRILYAKVHFGVIDKWAKEADWAPWLTKADDAQLLTQTVAEQGIVLLRNGPTRALADDVLPLSRAAVNRIAVVGKFANSENMGDKGSSDAKVVDSSLVFTPYEGLYDALGATNTSKTSCGGQAKCALTYEFVQGNETSIQASDVVFVVGAYYYADLARSSAGEEGEWKDRVSMSLPQRDIDNLNAVIAMKAAKPSLKIVVLVKSGGAVVMKPWIDSVDAVFMVWFAGMREGTALGELVFGDVNPSGKVVQSFPVAESDLPAFDNAAIGDVQYSYYHGYRYLDRANKTPLFPFGFGQSYTTFAYSNLQVVTPTAAADGTVTVKVDVKNTGPVAGAEVVQLYVGFGNTAVNDTWGRPKKTLAAFGRTGTLAPDASETVTLTVKVADLAYWNTATKAMTVEKMEYPLWVGPSSDTTDANTKTSTFTVQ
ncbi:MAG: glycoside hydrolase family 3 N-terminal domain-containing protein [Anaeromyxobacteraceae bacterium]